MIWTPKNTAEAAQCLRRYKELTAALRALSASHGETITEGMLKGAFMRAGLGGVREKLRMDRPTRPRLETRAPDERAYIVTSDQHYPYHDPNCEAAIADFADDLRPDGWVINGDFLDLLELSRHSAGSLAKLENRRICKTWLEANRALDLFRDAGGPQCTDFHLIDGNHEDRIHRWLANADNGVFEGDEGLSIAHRLHLADRGITYHEGYPDAGVDIGKLYITHGRFTNKYHAAKMLDYYRHSVMYGHTHTPQTHYASALHGQQVAIGTGHLGDVDSPAMGYAKKPNAWVKGFAVVYVRPDGSFTHQTLHFWQGQLTYANRTYGRRTK